MILCYSNWIIVTRLVKDKDYFLSIAKQTNLEVRMLKKTYLGTLLIRAPRYYICFWSVFLMDQTMFLMISKLNILL